jgi:alkyl sulfatase BDS1-like metallo-beta-lactamase superfamily hydrolase
VANQRDTYRFLHDRALNLANQGETMPDLANANFFPKGLAADASSHGYYGTLSHNLRAVYNFYLGYYDANPATLDPLLPTESAKRYVELKWINFRQPHQTNAAVTSSSSCQGAFHM